MNDDHTDSALFHLLHRLIQHAAHTPHPAAYDDVGIGDFQPLAGISAVGVGDLIVFLVKPDHDLSSPF